MAYITAQVEARKTAIASLLLKGFSETQIQQQLVSRGFSPVSEPTLRKYVKQVKDEWKAARAEMIEERVSKELRVLEDVRRMAYEGFDKSRQDAVVEELSRETEPISGQDTQPTAPNGNHLAMGIRRIIDPPTITTTKHKVKRTGQSGDPRFLDVITSTSKEIRTLLGIDEQTVKKIELTVRQDGAYSPEQLREMEPEELTKLLTEEIVRSSDTE